MLEKSFPFLINFRLTAVVNSKLKKYLKISYIENGKEKDSTSIWCIHTKISEIPAEKLETALKDDPNSFVTNMRESSSGTVKLKDLSFQEDLNAFYSWVQGIAEGGERAFYIQEEFENSRIYAYPISSMLLSFVAKYREDIFQAYLSKIEKECKFEGKWHISSLRANLNNILLSIKKMDRDKKLKYFTYVVDSNFPEKSIDEDILLMLYDQKSIYDIYKNHPIFKKLDVCKRILWDDEYTNPHIMQEVYHSRICSSCTFIFLIMTVVFACLSFSEDESFVFILLMICFFILCFTSLFAYDYFNKALIDLYYASYLIDFKKGEIVGLTNPCLIKTFDCIVTAKGYSKSCKCTVTLDIDTALFKVHYKCGVYLSVNPEFKVMKKDSSRKSIFYSGSLCSNEEMSKWGNLFFGIENGKFVADDFSVKVKNKMFTDNNLLIHYIGFIF